MIGDRSGEFGGLVEMKTLNLWLAIRKKLSRHKINAGRCLRNSWFIQSISRPNLFTLMVSRVTTMFNR